MSRSNRYDHPIPGRIVRRAAGYYTVPADELHELLESIDRLDGLRVELEKYAKGTEDYEVLRRDHDVTFYRVGEGWVSKVCGEFDDPHFNAPNALMQCYDRFVLQKTNAHIDSGCGFALTTYSSPNR